jgi:hypothetical protein
VARINWEKIVMGGLVAIGCAGFAMMALVFLTIGACVVMLAGQNP